jgi:hypothetical protein
MLLGLYRDGLAASALEALLESVDPEAACRLRLGPLGDDAVAGIAAFHAGEAPPVEVLAAMRRDTGGVPLRVHRAARDWATARVDRRLSLAASRGAVDRGELRTVETEIADGVVDRQRLRRPPPGQTVGRAVVCPYKGLARFEPSDAAYFFGRERLAAELVARLVGTGLLGVIGPSGSGKSSLVRAGLLPALAEGVLPGSQRWRQVIMRPGEHPMRELARMLDGGDDSPGMVGRAAEHCVRADGRLLLVVDQFEEVFTACQDSTSGRASSTSWWLGPVPSRAPLWWLDSGPTTTAVAPSIPGWPGSLRPVRSWSARCSPRSCAARSSCPLSVPVCKWSRN